VDADLKAYDQRLQSHKERVVTRITEQNATIARMEKLIIDLMERLTRAEKYLEGCEAAKEWLPLKKQSGTGYPPRLAGSSPFPFLPLSGWLWYVYGDWPAKTRERERE
jgi:hypothetical protein